MSGGPYPGRREPRAATIARNVERRRAARARDAEALRQALGPLRPGETSEAAWTRIGGRRCRWTVRQVGLARAEQRRAGERIARIASIVEEHEADDGAP
jgi:hypothetical protein